MFLLLNHKKLDVYSAAQEIVTECYRLMQKLPTEEKYALGAQIRRAAVSIVLNISEGASRKSSAERKRFYEVARSSLIEIDCAIEVAVTLNYIQIEETQKLGILINRCFGMLSRMITKT